MILLDCDCLRINAKQRDKIHPFRPGTVVFSKMEAALRLNRGRVLNRHTAKDKNLTAATPRAIEPMFLYGQAGYHQRRIVRVHKMLYALGHGSKYLV